MRKGPQRYCDPVVHGAVKLQYELAWHKHFMQSSGITTEAGSPASASCAKNEIFEKSIEFY